MGGFPGTLTAVLVLLFAVAPGFAYRKVLRRLVIQDERSAVAEVVELFAIGALTTSTAAVAVFATGEFVDGLLSLREAVTPAGRDYSWVRRTRIGGDSWEFEDVPLGEGFERYRIRVMQGGSVVREAEVGAPVWSYAAAEIAADGIAGEAEIRVAQLSDAFGAGPAKVLTVTF